MSVEAITWAIGQPIEQSSTKFVLVLLANCASGADPVAYPSVKYLADTTGLDRKTVIRALGRLVDAGYIEDTGHRKGATRQILVYRVRFELPGSLPKEAHYCYRCTDLHTGQFYIGVRTCFGDPARDTQYRGSGRWIRQGSFFGEKQLEKEILATFGSRIAAEDAERELIAANIDAENCMNMVVPPKRTEIATLQRVPEFPPKSGKKAHIDSQKRDTETLEPKGNKKQPPDKPAAAMPDLPSWVEPEAWEGFVAMRKRERHPLTAYAARLVLKELDKLRTAGADPTAVLDQSTRNGWRDVFAIRQPMATTTGGFQRPDAPRVPVPDAADVMAQHRARKPADPEVARAALADLKRSLGRGQ